MISANGLLPETARTPIVPIAMKPGFVISYPPQLPITRHREELQETIRGNRVVIVAGETGSGKTTQIPKMCLEVCRPDSPGMIGCTQPRRIAAMTVAERVARELRDEGGRHVGYQVRFDNRCGPDTRIKFMTDGILLSETRRDPELRAYDVIMIDEVHERTLNIDFLLGYVQRLLQRRRDLKVLISSATLDVERFSEYFCGAPIVRIPGKTYPVDVIYRPPSDEDASLPHTVAAAVDEISAIDQRGDILVFLSGERDIRECGEVLTRRRLPRTEIVPLLARLPAAEQRRAFQTGGNRRIVLATNVAETSVTIPGIRYVVDSGQARISRYNHRTHVQRLHIEAVSQASADQRKGRCGRVAPGVCLRLYDENDFNRRDEYTEPEIRRTSLASVILTMLDIGLGTIEDYPFIEPPSPVMIRSGHRELRSVGATDENRALTPLGHKLARFPLEPSLARMLLDGARNGALTETLVIVAGLSVDDPRLRPMAQKEEADRLHARYRTETSDFGALLRLWQTYDEAQRSHRSRTRMRSYCRENFLSYRRMREWQDVHGQLKQLCREMRLKQNSNPAGDTDIHKALLSGLLHGIGVKDPDGGYRGARGILFHVHPGSGLFGKSPEWIMASELVDTSRLYARCVARIEPEWIEPLAGDLCARRYGPPFWDSETGYVRAPEEVLLYGLPIVRGRRRNYGPIDPIASRALFLRHAFVYGETTQPPPFLKTNQALVGEYRALETKSRRRDLLVGDEALAEFYDTRLPPDILSAPALHAWLRRAPAEAVAALEMTPSDVLAREPDSDAHAAFPDAINIDGRALPLTYRYQPGRTGDGITCTVPVDLLQRLRGWRSDWLVPGALPDKIDFMLRSLPKRYRRLLVPVPRTTKELMQVLRPYESPLLEAISRAILQTRSVRIPEDAWPRELPDSFRMRFDVVDQDGEIIAQGHDVSELCKILESQTVSADGPDGGSSPWERDGITTWDFGDLPEHIDVGDGGWQILNVPALVDRQDHVALRLFADAREARREHRRGIHRLYAINLADACKGLKTLPLPARSALASYLACGGDPAGLQVEISERALDSLCLEQGELPRTAGEFEARLDAARTGLYAAARDIQKQVGGILVHAGSLAARVNDLAGPAEIHADLRAQLSGLVYPGFVTATATGRLHEYDRYFRGIERRLERLRHNPDKDLRCLQQLAPYLQRLTEVAARAGSVPPDPEELDKYRWMLEEWRISLFAQELGTPYPVSAKRLERQWRKVLDPDT